ncbi:MAG: hypothetical protein JNM17_22765 [Archangium sp.]|nr:hypothetical protein [Archangium sp.]
MVQVDVFWSYGIGAGLGLASAAGTAKKRESVKEALSTPFAFQVLLFLAIVFAPSGFVLLWNFPSWETMHVGTRDLPGWLVAIFGVTNITQGLLGFVVARHLTSTNRAFSAYLHWVGGYFGMFFILVHGWDGSGYQRFLSPTREALDGWTWATGQAWLTSDVAFTLEAMGVVLIPWLIGMTVAWLRIGAPRLSRIGAGASVLALLILGVPALAIASSLMVRAGGPIAGTIGTLVLFAALCAPKYGLLRKHCESLGFVVANESAAVAPLTAERAS